MVALIILLVMVSAFIGAITTAACFEPGRPFHDRETELVGKTIGISLLTLSLGVVVAFIAS